MYLAEGRTPILVSWNKNCQSRKYPLPLPRNQKHYHIPAGTTMIRVSHKGCTVALATVKDPAWCNKISLAATQRNQINFFLKKKSFLFWGYDCFFLKLSYKSFVVLFYFKVCNLPEIHFVYGVRWGSNFSLIQLHSWFFFFFSSTSLLLPTHLPPSSCTQAQSCNPMDFSLPDSSVHGFFQARILEWVAISFSIMIFFLILFIYLFFWLVDSAGELLHTP